MISRSGFRSPSRTFLRTKFHTWDSEEKQVQSLRRSSINGLKLMAMSNLLRRTVTPFMISDRFGVSGESG